jgi:hypothetical protein
MYHAQIKGLEVDGARSTNVGRKCIELFGRHPEGNKLLKVPNYLV